MRNCGVGLVAASLLLASPIQSQETGTLVVLGGVTTPLDPSGSTRGGVHASIGFVTGRFSLGPEVGWYFTGGTEHSPSNRPENTVILGGVARYDLARQAAWRPYLAGGMGIQFWESSRGGYSTENAFDLNLGLGLRHMPASFPLGLTAELRLHTSVQSADLDGRTFLSGTIGLGWRW